MTKSYKYYALVLLLMSMLESCYSPRYVFSPSTQNIPLLHRKNDLELSGSYSSSLNLINGKNDSFNGFDVQGAWAVTNHIAMIAGESMHWEKNNSNDTYYFGDTSRLSYKRQFTEIGVGYYSPVNYNPRMMFQAFAGTDFGLFDINDAYTSDNITSLKYHHSHVMKFFFQPSVNYHFLKNFWTSVSSRITMVIFSHINTNYNAAQLDNYILDSLTVSPVFFWEPAVNYMIGFKKIPVKLKLQGSLCILINHRFVAHRSGNAAIGIVADFPKKRIHIKESDKN